MKIRVLFLGDDTKYCYDGNEAELSCPENHIIDAKWAFYKTKYYGYYYKRSYCGDPNAFQKVKARCNGLNTCQFICDDNFFDETTCKENTEKLKVSFECIPGRFGFFIRTKQDFSSYMMLIIMRCLLPKLEMSNY